MDRRIENPKDSNVGSNDKRNYHPTLKGSNVYRKLFSGVFTTPSGSNVYRHYVDDFYTTPSGSQICSFGFYKHPIPSGLFFKNMEADIQKGLAELKGISLG